MEMTNKEKQRLQDIFDKLIDDLDFIQEPGHEAMLQDVGENAAHGLQQLNEYVGDVLTRAGYYEPNKFHREDPKW